MCYQFCSVPEEGAVALHYSRQMEVDSGLPRCLEAYAENKIKKNKEFAQQN